MNRSSPQELAEKYGANATTQAFEEAKREKAKDHVVFAESWLEERYGQGGSPAKKRKVRCDGCSRPRWIDDMAVLGTEALCEDCMPKIPSAHKSEVIYTLTGVQLGEMTSTAREVSAYWEAS